MWVALTFLAVSQCSSPFLLEDVFNTENKMNSFSTAKLVYKHFYIILLYYYYYSVLCFGTVEDMSAVTAALWESYKE